MSNIVGFLRRCQLSPASIKENETRPGDFMGEMLIIQHSPDYLSIDPTQFPNEVKHLAGTDTFKQGGARQYGAVDCNIPLSERAVSFDFMQLPFPSDKL